MLRTQFKMEMVVYTQDSTYSDHIGKRKREDEQANIRKILNWNSTNTDISATLAELMFHTKSYYQASVIFTFSKMCVWLCLYYQQRDDSCKVYLNYIWFVIFYFLCILTSYAVFKF